MEEKEKKMHEEKKAQTEEKPQEEQPETKKKERKRSKKDEEIASLREEVASLKDRLLRNQAELANFKRRMNEERLKDLKYANAELAKSLLPVIDSFKIALEKENDGQVKPYLKGFEMILRDLVKALEEAGLEEIEAEGEVFDPSLHQAVAKEERDDLEEGIVVEEFQKGYKFKDRLLRAAMVKVSERPEKSAEEKDPTQEGEC